MGSGAKGAQALRRVAQHAARMPPQFGLRSASRVELVACT